MRTLHRYLLRQMLATLFMTVAVATFVLMLANALRELLNLLINRQATFGGVAEGVALLIPWVVAFALPAGMLTAALLVFGRFSADQELTAARASGISLVALISPILWLSILLCGVCAVVNLEIAPRCRVAFKELLAQMGASMAPSMLPEGRFVNEMPGFLIYVAKNDGRNLKDIRIWQDGGDQAGASRTMAPTGYFEVSNSVLTLHLLNAQRVDQDPHDTNRWFLVLGDVDKTLDLRKAVGSGDGIDIGNMTFRQLRATLRQLDRSLPEKSGSTRQELLDRRDLVRRQEREMTMPLQVQMHRQVAFSFACFGFTLVGIPLGIRAHRRETNTGIAMALALVGVYYCFIILGQSLQMHANLAPHLIVWLPNFIFELAGAIMLWRANRGG